MRQITLADRLRYEFDNLMSRGTNALVATLFFLTLLLIVSITTFLYLFDSKPGSNGTPRSFARIFWDVLNHTFDPGSLEGTEGDLLYLGSMILATLGGIFIVSALIGIIATGFKNKLEELRKGHSFVAEAGHTLILGWSATIFTIIRQLVLADANQSRSAIVILADRDKVEMEDEIRTKVGFTGRTRIICRTGKPSDFDDLEIVNPNMARSMIILPSECLAGDVQVIKTLLALIQHPHRRPQPYHIVTQLYDGRNQAIARMIGKDEVLAFRLGAVLGFILVESIRQVQLSRVIIELIRFEGGEIYFREEPDLVGKTFGDILLLYEDATAIGLRLPQGEILVNPPLEQAIVPGTKIIGIADNDDSFRLSEQQDYSLDATAMRVPQPHSPQIQRILVLGWNGDAPEMITRLDRYMADGSSLLLVGTEPDTLGNVTDIEGKLNHLQVKFRSGNIQDRALLDELDIPAYDRVVVLCPFNRASAEVADAETLIVLLHLRDISERSGRKFPIITELMQESNRNLVRVARVDDVIISNQLVSLLLAQISQNRERLPTLLRLLDPDGQHLQLKPVEDYVALGNPVNFYTVVESAKRCGHLAIGYCIATEADDANQNFGVRLNPNKAARMTFTHSDRLIVVAKDEVKG